MQQIADWLQRLGLGQYAKAFAENDINFAVLPDLTDQDLKELGVASLGHRRQLLRAITELKGSEEGTRKPSTEDIAPIAPHDTAERRQVTVMFSDLVGSTALSSRMDPEDLREVISAYQKCVAQTVQRFGGFVAKYMGDGVLVYFGYPQAHEDDAERAVRAGLELIAAVAGLKTRVSLQTRVGIATGLVVVGELIGSGEAQERGIFGETPNMAARLQGVAEPNTVVIAESTRKLLGNLFELEDLGAKDLKGITGPVRAWAALRASSAEGRFEAMHATGLTALVGREEETELLMRRWERAKQGDGSVVLVCGEPGIGKSRIAQAVQDRVGAEPHTRLRYFCSPHHQDSALHPVISQLERAAGFRREDTNEQRLTKLETILAQATTDPGNAVPLLAELLSIPTGERYPPLNLPPQKRKEKTLKALLAQGEGLAARQPVLMVFEDAHWIDPTTREWLDLVVDRVSTLRVLMIVTFRPEFSPSWVGRPQVTLITLNRLPPRQRAQMISGVIGGKPLPKEITDQIIEHTDGIPLFIEELTKAVIESGVVADAGDHYQITGPLTPLAIPTSLHASLLARLDRLAPVREVAQIAAALGRSFSHELISAVASMMPEERLDDALARLVHAELIFRRGIPPDCEYTFKHALVRDAAYSSLLLERRRQLHGQIANVLERQDPELVRTQPETVALHYSAAGLNDQAADYYGKAAERSMAASANAEAIAHLRKALDLVKQLPASPERTAREWQIQIAMGAPLIATRSWAAPEVEAVYLRARELAANLGETPALFQSVMGLWVSNLVRAKLSAASDLSVQLLGLSDRLGNQDLILLANVAEIASRYWSGQPASVLSIADKAFDLYDSKRHGGHKLMFQDPGVTVLSHHSLALWLLGYAEQAHEKSIGSIALGRVVDHPFTLCVALEWDMFLRHMRREPGLVADRAKELLSISAEQGFANFAADATIHEAWTGDETRDKPEKIRGALAERLALGTDLCHPFFVTLLSQRLVKTGAVAEAIATLADAIAQTERTGEAWWQPEMYRMRGELMLMKEPTEAWEAEAHYNVAIERALQQRAKSHELRAAMSLARLWRDQGKVSEARELLAPVYGWFTEGFDTRDLKEAKALLEELGT